MDKRIVFEAPVYTLEAAILAASNGVDRLELCADFGEGGTSPSAGLLKVVKAHVAVPVFVMIRPRGGDFVYSRYELQAMREDIRILGRLGADGFVLGVLHPSGAVNETACAALIDAAEGKPCTFHRAFDLIPDKLTALDRIISLGFKRILTSGGSNTVSEGLSVLAEVLTHAGERITVMPGGGLATKNLAPLARTGQLREVHRSCKMLRPSDSVPPDPLVRLSLLDEMERKILTVDPALVRSFREALDDLTRDLS
ncbi:copper homeostasis protein [Cyclobacterium xiamenense]|uniref:PF03932 family protein CutC n=1 Tax=Cyclobacterium xiamenense TaxID=1297121 RepID=A0A1H7B082_9BACT|nr:copper homeostasis protein CutC [Cyclobacterium xiamenense]SEJ71229.1 copper homeostasis protein [Cyclobacterium xiamenense]